MEEACLTRDGCSGRCVSGQTECVTSRTGHRCGCTHSDVRPAFCDVMPGRSDVRPYIYTPSDVRPGFASRTAKVLGCAQISLGVICFLFQIFAILLHCGLATTGEGIWAGIMFCVSGSFGVVSSQKKTNCMIITFMVLSIISVVFSACALVLACEGIIIDRHHLFLYEGYHNSTRGSRVAVDSILLVLVLCEMAVAIWSSVICCKAICCLPGMDDGYSVPYRMQYSQVEGHHPLVFYTGNTNQNCVFYAVPQDSVRANTLLLQQGHQQLPHMAYSIFGHADSSNSQVTEDAVNAVTNKENGYFKDVSFKEDGL